MVFDIRFDKISKKIGQGLIILDQFSERFESPLHFWTADDYKQQWRDGIKRILDDEMKSALVTAMYPPESANFIMWWNMYRDQESVVFRNHLLLMEQLEQPFNIARLYSYVPERLPSVDEEYQVSEWEISFDRIREFAGESSL
jgi:hypothetical protein